MRLSKARVSKRGQYDILRRNSRLPGFSAQITAPAHVIETVNELSYQGCHPISRLVLGKLKGQNEYAYD